MSASVWSVVVVSHDAATALGEGPHVVQVRAFALARSRAAFARALERAGLGCGSEAATSRYVAVYGGVTGNERAVALASQQEGAVFVESSVSRRDVIPLRWPLSVNGQQGEG